MKISGPTRLPPQRYMSQTGERWLIEITTDGVEIDLAGAVLEGEDFCGCGIYVHDRESVVIKNGLIKGFHYGIRAESVKKLTVSGCVVTENYNPPGIGWLDDTARPEAEGFGGGVYIRDGLGGVVENNELGGNFNGLDLVHCTDGTVRGNSASSCGNVGIHLLDSSRNTIEGNGIVGNRTGIRLWAGGRDHETDPSQGLPG